MYNRESAANVKNCLLYKNRYHISGFIQGGSLRDHLKTHIGDPFTCSYCEKTFSRSASYKAHLLTHKVDQTSQDNTTKNQNALQKVQCNICNKLLSSKGVLKTHLLIHGERKKYLCSVCGRGFCNNSLLQSHLKVIIIIIQ